MKDVECLSGIKAYTIRTWEKRYGFLKPARTLTNIRSYNTKEVVRILSVALLNKYGNKISQLAKMSEDKLREHVELLQVPNPDDEVVIFTLIQKALEGDAEFFESVLDNYASWNDIDSTATKIIIPFFERIEVIWQTGNITPVQNYFLSITLRQYLNAAIKKISFTKIKSQKSACLFLPEKEKHDLGLLCAAYLLKCNGTHIIYLGSNTPLSDVEYIIKKMLPDFIFMHFTSANSIKFQKFFADIENRFKIPLVISGNLGLVFQKKIPANIIFKKRINDVITFAESLNNSSFMQHSYALQK